ncbi:hypothetical protein L596_022289 [Steinernema carpocapsae]|uniref:RING-type domain-containing protein n=1 Tax=Steinernema carpocapsae TaxID=34508 RepID=A0A4U5MLD6_STECR|nr:hypothetical protein L596_022289 [Steinernema carpocapsae]
MSNVSGLVDWANRVVLDIPESFRNDYISQVLQSSANVNPHVIAEVRIPQGSHYVPQPIRPDIMQQNGAAAPGSNYGAVVPQNAASGQALGQQAQQLRGHPSRYSTFRPAPALTVQQAAQQPQQGYPRIELVRAQPQVQNLAQASAEAQAQAVQAAQTDAQAQAVAQALAHQGLLAQIQEQNQMILMERAQAQARAVAEGVDPAQIEAEARAHDQVQAEQVRRAIEMVSQDPQLNAAEAQQQGANPSPASNFQSVYSQALLNELIHRSEHRDYPSGLRVTYHNIPAAQQQPTNVYHTPGGYAAYQVIQSPMHHLRAYYQPYVANQDAQQGPQQAQPAQNPEPQNAASLSLNQNAQDDQGEGDEYSVVSEESNQNAEELDDDEEEEQDPAPPTSPEDLVPFQVLSPQVEEPQDLSQSPNDLSPGKRRLPVEELECPICYNIFNNPKVLTCCGGSICGVCEKKINKERCPICNSLRSRPHRPLVANVALKNHIETTQNHSVNCSNCQELVFAKDTYMCQTCQKDKICSHCVIKDHTGEHIVDRSILPTKKQKQELFERVELTVIEAYSSIDRVLTGIRAQMDVRVKEYEKIRDDVINTPTMTKSDVKEAMQEIGKIAVEIKKLQKHIVKLDNSLQNDGHLATYTSADTPSTSE